MKPAQAATKAAETLSAAAEAAAQGFPKNAQALAAIAAQWTNLGATLAANPAMITEAMERPADGNMDRLEDGR